MLTGNTSNVPGSFEGLVSRALLWLSSTGTPDPPEVRRRLVQITFMRKAAYVISLICVLSAGTAVIALTGQTWAYFWMAAEFAIFVARIGIVTAVERKPDLDPEKAMYVLMLVAMAWAATFGIGAYLCIMSGNTTLIALASILAMGGIGTVASRNAVTPRQAVLLMCLVALPYVVAALTSPTAGMFVVSFFMPFYTAAMIAMMAQNYDITIRMIRAEYLNRQLAMTDVLTGLPNRMFLDDELDRLCAAIGRGEKASGFSLLYIDLDGFKAVNDIRGHAAGDFLLKAVTQRLARTVREGDSVCRLGGDEFVILLPRAGAVEAASLADRIIGAVARPFDIDVGELVRIGTSIGSVTAPADGDTPASLIGNADMALYAAKAAGKGTHRAHAASSV